MATSHPSLLCTMSEEHALQWFRAHIGLQPVQTDHFGVNACLIHGIVLSLGEKHLLRPDFFQSSTRVRDVCKRARKHLDSTVPRVVDAKTAGNEYPFLEHERCFETLWHFLINTVEARWWTTHMASVNVGLLVYNRFNMRAYAQMGTSGHDVASPVVSVARSVAPTPGACDDVLIALWCQTTDNGAGLHYEATTSSRTGNFVQAAHHAAVNDAVANGPSRTTPPAKPTRWSRFLAWCTNLRGAPSGATANANVETDANANGGAPSGATANANDATDAPVAHAASTRAATSHRSASHKTTQPSKASRDASSTSCEFDDVNMLYKLDALNAHRRFAELTSHTEFVLHACAVCARSLFAEDMLMLKSEPFSFTIDDLLNRLGVKVAKQGKPEEEEWDLTRLDNESLENLFIKHTKEEAWLAHGHEMKSPCSYFCGINLCVAYAFVKNESESCDAATPLPAWDYYAQHVRMKICRCCNEGLHLDETDTERKKKCTLPPTAIANDRDWALHYVATHDLVKTLDSPALRKLVRAQVPMSALLPELSPATRKLLAVVYVRSWIYKLKGEFSNYVEYSRMKGHIVSFDLHRASRTALLDIDSLPDKFHLVFVGQPRDLADLRERVKKRLTKSKNLPIVEREDARAYVHFFKKHWNEQDAKKYFGDLWSGERVEVEKVLNSKVNDLPEHEIPDSIADRAWTAQTESERAIAAELDDPSQHTYSEQRPTEDNTPAHSVATSPPTAPDETPVELHVSGSVNADGASGLTTTQQFDVALTNLRPSGNGDSPSDRAIVHKIHDGQLWCTYGNPRLFEHAYPDCFLKGTGGPEDESEIVEPDQPLRRARRPVKLSMQAYASCLLRHYSAFAATHPDIPYHLFDMLQMRAAARSVRFSLRYGITSNNVGEMLDVMQRAYNPPLDASPDQVQDWKLQAASFRRNLCMVGAKALGSPYNRKAKRANCMGMITRFGPHFLFLTLNPADGFDLRSYTLADGGFRVELTVPCKNVRAAACKKNPLAAALYFDKIQRAYLDAFLNKPFRSKSQTARGGLFSLRPALAYIGMVEAQKRQALHCHYELWFIELILGDLQEFLADRDSVKELFDYLDRVVCQQLPSEYRETAPPARAADVPTDASQPRTLSPVRDVLQREPACANCTTPVTNPRHTTATEPDSASAPPPAVVDQPRDLACHNCTTPMVPECTPATDRARAQSASSEPRVVFRLARRVVTILRDNEWLVSFNVSCCNAIAPAARSVSHTHTGRLDGGVPVQSVSRNRARRPKRLGKGRTAQAFLSLRFSTSPWPSRAGLLHHGLHLQNGVHGRGLNADKHRGARQLTSTSRRRRGSR